MVVASEMPLPLAHTLRTHQPFSYCLRYSKIKKKKE